MSKSTKGISLISKFVGGYHSSKAPWHWRLHSIKSIEALDPSVQITSTCAFVAPADDPRSLLIIKNKRGYDLPGGHVEPGELYAETVVREVREEAQVDIHNLDLFAMLESDFDDKPSGLLFYKALYYKIEPFQITAEISNRYVMSHQEFIKHYFGNKQLMSALLNLAFPKVDCQRVKNPRVP